MKYPFTPEILDALPEELAELYRFLEKSILTDICTQLKSNDSMNEVTMQKIRALRSHGLDMTEIERAIKKNTKLTQKKLDALFADVVARNQAYTTSLITKAGLTMPETIVGAQEVKAFSRQTENEFRNLTQSMGFVVHQGAKQVLLTPAKAYQWALDNAEMYLMSGSMSYTEAIKNAIKELAESGLRTVEYESGHISQLDVAVRRAVLTGVNQINSRYVEQSADYLETDLFEVSAHSGARDTGKGWQNHKNWQGKVYSTKDNSKYPNIYAVCGLGEVDGLEGANCRHRRYPFVDGVSERTYTDEQLANIDKPSFWFEGKKYSTYAATQEQRRIERTIRKLERKSYAYHAAGMTDDESAMRVRIGVLRSKYYAFSKKAGLPLQTDRMKVYYS